MCCGVRCVVGEVAFVAERAGPIGGVVATWLWSLMFCGFDFRGWCGLGVRCVVGEVAFVTEITGTIDGVVATWLWRHFDFDYFFPLLKKKNTD